MPGKQFVSKTPPLGGDLRLSSGRRMVLIGVALLLCGLVWLYCVPPTQSGMYPQCAFHRLTGLYCPGCGATRSLHFLLHGEWRLALQCHLLLIVGLPWLGIYSVRTALAAWQGRPIQWGFGRLRLWGIAVGVLVLFGVLRNLPFEAFRWLAPP